MVVREEGGAVSCSPEDQHSLHSVVQKFKSELVLKCVPGVSACVHVLVFVLKLTNDTN